MAAWDNEKHVASDNERRSYYDNAPTETCGSIDF